MSDEAETHAEQLTTTKCAQSVGIDWLSAATSLTSGWFNVVNSIVSANLEWIGTPNRQPSGVSAAEIVEAETETDAVLANFTLPSSQKSIPSGQQVRVFWTKLTAIRPGFSISTDKVKVQDTYTALKSKSGADHIEIDGLQPGQIVIAADATEFADQAGKVGLTGMLYAMVNENGAWVQRDQARYQVTIGSGENTP